MEGAAGNRRLMVYGRFTFRGGWQYYRTKRGRRTPEGKPKLYLHSVDRTYIKGEEQDAWSAILSEHNGNKQKEFVVKDKKIEDLFEMGYSMANKDGSVYTG